MYVALHIYDVNDEDKIRILESESLKVNELDTQELSLIGFDLGKKIVQGMLLEGLGKRRSEKKFI